jgi:hypothetical protein
VEEAIDKGTEKVTRRLIDLAEIKVGSRVLEIGNLSRRTNNYCK